MPSLLVIVAAGFFLLFLSVSELFAAWHALRWKRWFDGGVSLLFGVALLSLALLAGTIGVATRGYRSLTEEDIAATVKTVPLPRQHFRATVIMPGRLAMYDLSGDAFYIDGYIIKWPAFMNLLGLHTAYELDRIAGRYNDVRDERTKPHTVYSLARPKPLNMYRVVKAFPPISLLVDAEYGSATFIAARRPATFHVLVSNTGLLIRPALE
jgi:hypothetical protein